jgi:hypothetical protein
LTGLFSFLLQYGGRNMAGSENTSGLFLCPVLGGRYALGGVHSKISMTPFKFADYQEFERRKGYDESIHLEK